MPRKDSIRPFHLNKRRYDCDECGRKNLRKFFISYTHGDFAFCKKCVASLEMRWRIFLRKYEISIEEI